MVKLLRTITFLVWIVKCVCGLLEKSGSIGLLIDLHTTGPSIDDRSTASHCSRLNTAAVQHYLAAQWAVQVINNQSITQGLNIGVELFDSCGDKDVALRDVFYAVKKAVDPRGKTPLLGLIGVGDPEIIGETISTLHAFSVPLVLASPRLSEMNEQQENILTTAPDMNTVVQPVVDLGKHLGATSMSFISSCSESVKNFGYAAMDSGVLLGRMLLLRKRSKVIADVVKKFLDESSPNETLAMVLEPEEIYQLGNHLRNFQNTKNIRIITGTIGLNKNLLKLWKNLFGNGFLIEPDTPELPDFRNYILYRLMTAQRDPSETLLREYISAVNDCSWAHTPNCGDISSEVLAGGLRIDPEVTFVVKAVSAYSAAVFVIETEHCRNQSITNCSALPASRLQEDILPTLTHLSLATRSASVRNRDKPHGAPFELQGATLRITHTGHLVSNKYVISVITDAGDTRYVSLGQSAGWWSIDQGLVIDTLADPYLAKVVAEQARKFNLQESSPRLINQPFESYFIKNVTDDIVPLEISTSPVLASFRFNEESGVEAKRVNQGSLGRSWATVVAAIAAIGLFITLFMFVYVLLKICDGTLAGNQSMGLVLLLAVGVIYASITLFILPATEVKCILRLFLYPISLSLCYGLLIVKVMQLRALVLLGLGGRISYLNQYIMLFFIVLVQIVINVQWFLTNRPQLRELSEGKLGCYMPRQDFLLLHLYPTILVTIAFIYGLSVLKIKRNYKEGRWITLASGLSLPVLAALGLIHTLTSSKYSDVTTCIVLILLATILVMALFIPKMSTLSKQGSHFHHKKMQTDSSTGFSESRLRTASRLHSPPYLYQYTDGSKGQIYHISTTGAYP